MLRITNKDLSLSNRLLEMGELIDHSREQKLVDKVICTMMNKISQILMENKYNDKVMKFFSRDNSIKNFIEIMFMMDNPNVKLTIIELSEYRYLLDMNLIQLFQDHCISELNYRGRDTYYIRSTTPQMKSLYFEFLYKEKNYLSKLLVNSRLYSNPNYVALIMTETIKAYCLQKKDNKLLSSWEIIFVLHWIKIFLSILLRI